MPRFGCSSNHDLVYEFAEVAAIIIAGIVAGGKLKRNKSHMMISVTCMPLSLLESGTRQIQ